MDGYLPILLASGGTDIQFLTLPTCVVQVGVILLALAGAALLEGCSEKQSKVYETFVPTSSTLEQFERYCSVCHTDARTGAPLAGDRQAWQERLAKGMQILIENTIDGVGDMPPLGFCFECGHDEFEALINYMTFGDTMVSDDVKVSGDMTYSEG